jgi:hypothetical protein
MTEKASLDYLQEKLTAAEILEYIARNTDEAEGGDESRSLFEQSWQDYREVERQSRELLMTEDSDQAQELLAQVLLDIHIHPNSKYARDSAALWEAQYRWLHLFFRTGEQAFMEQAKLCDGIRHAQVEMVD